VRLPFAARNTAAARGGVGERPLVAGAGHDADAVARADAGGDQSCGETLDLGGEGLRVQAAENGQQIIAGDVGPRSLDAIARGDIARRVEGEGSGRGRAIGDRGEMSPETIKSIYFLARTDMKMRRWAEASSLLTRIYSMAPGFYREWNCDFLLGQCRRALGKD